MQLLEDQRMSIYTKLIKLPPVIRNYICQETVLEGCLHLLKPNVNA